MAFRPSDFREAAIVRKKGGNVANTILNLPRAAQGEFEMTDKEMARTRRLIYWMNKNHPRGYRFRTMREGPNLLVWRIK